MMKYAVSIAGVIIIFIACRKKENNEPETVACTVMNSYAVPALVVDSFSMRYPLKVITIISFLWTYLVSMILQTFNCFVGNVTPRKERKILITGGNIHSGLYRI